MPEIKITESNTSSASVTPDLGAETPQMVTPKYSIPRSGLGSMWGTFVFLFIVVASVIVGWFVLFGLPTDQPATNFDTYTQTQTVSTSLSDCNTPVNPYDESSSEHFAGFASGASGNSCSDGSRDFLEGCRSYQQLRNAYEACSRLGDPDIEPF